MTETITRGSLLVAAARALSYVREEPRSSNRSPAIDAMLALCGLGVGHPWCMAFVTWCGVQVFGAQWRAPRTASVAAFVAHARADGAVIPGPVRAGDLLCVWFPRLNRHAHIAIITGDLRADGTVPTIEGNTNAGGSRDGWGVFERTRRIAPADVIVRVAALT